VVSAEYNKVQKGIFFFFFFFLFFAIAKAQEEVGP
jgi:vacuolar-type H+-ATPase subunit I/STV1